MSFERRQEIARKRLSKIEGFEDLLESNLTILEKRLYSSFLENILSGLDQDSGKIKFNTNNVNSVTKLNAIIDKFSKVELGKLSSTYLKQIKEIQDSVLSQYGGLLDKNTSEAFIKRKNSAFSKAIGVIDDKIQEGGFVKELFNLDPIKKELQQELFKSVAGQSDINDLKKGIKDIIITDSKKRGVLNKRVNNQIADSYSQIERAEAQFFAQEIGMTAFIFFGTKIKTSRPFCITRAGKVFLVSEAQKWKTLNFQGKPDNYNPVVDLGGYNCRHTPNFITNQEALRRRSDLEIVNGVLRLKK